jgi:holo-[acyl-carrier protein] synthase
MNLRTKIWTKLRSFLRVGRLKPPCLRLSLCLTVTDLGLSRWAAKEACRKACPWLKSSNGFHNIIILPIHMSKDTSSGLSTAPAGLVLDEWIPSRQVGSAPSREEWEERADFDINTLEGQFCEVSISHDFEVATAVAIVPYNREET